MSPLALLLVAQIGLPPDEIIAANDLARLPPEVQPYIRYATFRHLPDEKRIAWMRVFTGHVQHLSRAPDITVPKLVGVSLLRMDLRDYHWQADTWERLGDPYTTVLLEIKKEWVHWPGGVWKDGKTYAANSFRYPVVKKVRATAPWLDTDSMKTLTTLARTQIPLTNGAWFFNQTCAQQNREVGYYDWLGIKNERDFQALIGFDPKLAKKFSPRLRESVSVSGVTTKARALARDSTAGEGGYWRSIDFIRILDLKDPLRILGDEIELHRDATEQYGLMRNGYWATFLGNAAGVAQDAAPGNIASDSFSISNDKQVHINVSCVRCHTKGGLKEIQGWVRANPARGRFLNSPDYKTQLELRSQYYRRLEPFMTRDRAIYEEAVKQTTGWTAEEYAKEYALFYQFYEDAKADLKFACDLNGIPTEVVLTNIKEMRAKGQYIDPVLDSLAGGSKIQKDDLERIIPLLHEAYRPVEIKLKKGVK